MTRERVCGGPTTQCAGKVAYGLAPHEGGTTTFYRNLSAGLRRRGWSVYAVAVGADSGTSCEERFGDGFSVVLAAERRDLRARVAAFLKWVEAERIDVVLPMCEEGIHAAVPHLPPSVRCVSRCSSITRQAYALATANLSRLHAVVAVCKRQAEELVKRWGVPGGKVRLIASGVDLAGFAPRTSGQSSEIRLAYVGRIADYDKGVMLLPKILTALQDSGVRFTCDIVGSGPDRGRLLKAVRRAPTVRLHGSLAWEDATRRLLDADVFLLPSRFEGLPNSLLEAMAAGCVPVASHIRGVTDMVIEDGVNGFLCPISDSGAFACAVTQLYRDRKLLSSMSQNARRRIGERFTLERMVDDYEQLFREVLDAPALAYKVRPLSDIALPPLLRPTWRTRVPLPVKNAARTVLARYFDYFG